MGLPKYVVNFDELAHLLENGIDLQGDSASENLADRLRDLLEKFPAFISLPIGIYSGYSQHSIGLHRYIPALAFDYELKHVFEEDVYLTGIVYSQTGWKALDCWSLYVGDMLLFDGIFTKEIGQYKHLNLFHGIEAGTQVKVVHHNHSGNSKQVWFDLDYLKINPDPYVPPEPEEPDDPTLVEPGDPIEIMVKPTEIKEVGYAEIAEGFTGELIFTMTFETVSGAAFPDLDVEAPNADDFGFNRQYLFNSYDEFIDGLSSCALAAYTGWRSNPEQMIFQDPYRTVWN